MSAILLFEGRINDESVACLRDIERIAGKECLTKGYSKIQRICASCVKIAEACHNADSSQQTLATFTRSTVLYVLQALRFMLQYDMITTGKIIVENLDPKRDGTPGLVHIILARMFLMDYVRRSIDELRGAPQSESCVRELDDVLRLFLDYPAYEAAFQKPDAEAACAATPSGGVDQEETGDLGCDQVDAQGISGCDQLDVHLQKFSTKPAHMLANFLFDVMAGSLDDTIKAALHGQGARQNNLKEIDFAGKDNMEALRDWKRALGVYKTIASATAPSTSHPASSAATSGGEDTEELKKHEERKSLVVVGHSHGSAGSETPSSQGNMQWVERYFPDFDGRVGGRPGHHQRRRGLVRGRHKFQKGLSEHQCIQEGSCVGGACGQVESQLERTVGL